MKKLTAMLLAMAMALSLAACNSNPGGASSEPPANSQSGDADPANTPGGGESSGPVSDPNAIDDNPSTADGKYEIAMITDVGDLKDKSFNEGTWNGVKLYAANNGKTYKYYRQRGHRRRPLQRLCGRH